jgi:hypothetical protein
MKSGDGAIYHSLLHVPSPGWLASRTVHRSAVTWPATDFSKRFHLPAEHAFHLNNDPAPRKHDPVGVFFHPFEKPAGEATEPGPEAVESKAPFIHSRKAPLQKLRERRPQIRPAPSRFIRGEPPSPSSVLLRTPAELPSDRILLSEESFPSPS